MALSYSAGEMMPLSRRIRRVESSKAIPFGLGGGGGAGRRGPRRLRERRAEVSANIAKQTGKRCEFHVVSSARVSGERHGSGVAQSSGALPAWRFVLDVARGGQKRV